MTGPRRLTISVPEDVANLVDGLPNVSAFFVDAVRRADRRDRLEALVDQATGGNTDVLRRARVRASLTAQAATQDLALLERPRTAAEVSAAVARILHEQPEDVRHDVTAQVRRDRRAA